MRVFGVALLMLGVAISPVLGQSGGHIGIYSDNPGWSDCNLVEAVLALNFVYVVHNATTEAFGAHFKVQDNWGAIHYAEDRGTNLWLGTGGPSIFDGGFIGYPPCTPLPHLLVTLTLVPLTPSGACGGELNVVADPTVASGQIEAYRCDSTIVPATGGTLTINSDPDECPCAVVGTKETTWSRIKAIYR